MSNSRCCKTGRPSHPLRRSILQRFEGGSLLKLSAPAASIARESLVHQKGTEERTKQTLGFWQKVGREGDPNDDLRAVLDELRGVGFIKCTFAGARPLTPLQRPQRAEYVRRRERPSCTPRAYHVSRVTCDCQKCVLSRIHKNQNQPNHCKLAKRRLMNQICVRHLHAIQVISCCPSRPTLGSMPTELAWIPSDAAALLLSQGLLPHHAYANSRSTDPYVNSRSTTARSLCTCCRTTVPRLRP